MSWMDHLQWRRSGDNWMMKMTIADDADADAEAKADAEHDAEA